MQILLADLLLQHLESADAQPRNRQLYSIMRQAILDGRLPGGTRLPATRDLARDLGLSRNTVLYAYEQLRAEGYVHSRTGSGTYVADTAPDATLLARMRSVRTPATPGGFALSRRGEAVVRSARASRQQWGAFMPGVPDIAAFPFKTWNRLSNKHWRMPTLRNLTYGHGGGHPALKKALAEHLRAARAVVCEPEQILVTDGIHQAIQLCVHLLADARDKAWVEEPGYWGIHKILAALGVEIVPIAVDAEGLAPSAQDMRRAPRLAFVTPSHQYPLGHVMSIARRRMLLEYANRQDVWIVEDDYDSEFRYGGRPVASLQGLEQHGRVLYVGTFSKTLFPGLRIGYLVLPPALVGAFQTGLAELYREGRWMTQAVLADFIAEGHYAAHIRRMRLLYGRRRGAMQAAIARHLGDATVVAADSNAGLHLTLELPRRVQDVEVSRRAAAVGLIALPLSHYYLHKPSRQGLVLGYGCVDENEIDRAVARLAAAMK